MKKITMLLVICSALFIPFYAPAEGNKKSSAITDFSPLHTAAQNLRKVLILIRKGDDERAKLYFAEAMWQYQEASRVLEKTIEQGNMEVNLQIEEERLRDKITARYEAAESDLRHYCWDENAGRFRPNPNCFRR
jgi:hypothetical protein